MITGIERKDIDRFDSLIGGASTVTLVAHTRPDGDALGCCTALSCYLAEKRGKDAAIALSEPYGRQIAFIAPKKIRKGIIFHSEDPQRAEARIAASDLIICLDCNGFSRTGRLEPALRESEAVKVMIDHHQNPDRDSFDLVFSKSDISSASELLYWILGGMPDIFRNAANLPRTSATALMAGMTTDTNNFANSVHDGTFIMASELICAGVDREAILERLYRSGRRNRLRLMGYLLDENMEITPEGTAFMIIDKEIRRRFDLREGETEGFVNIPLGASGIRMSLLLNEDSSGYFRVSVRSRRGVSAARFAERFFNGGGHENAAGGKLFLGDGIQGRGDAAEYIRKSSAIFFERA